MIERHALLDHWRNLDDEAVTLTELGAYEEELCWLVDLDAHEPESEKFEGYMGNYGNTLQREYHRAVVVLWPTRDRYSILAGSADPKGGAAAISALIRDAGKLDESALNDALLSLLEVWPGACRSDDTTLLREAISLAQYPNNDDTLIELLSSVSIAVLTPPRMGGLLSLGERRGRAFSQWLFDVWIGGQSDRTSTAKATTAPVDTSRIGRSFK